MGNGTNYENKITRAERYTLSWFTDHNGHHFLAVQQGNMQAFSAVSEHSRSEMVAALPAALEALDKLIEQHPEKYHDIES